MLLYMLCLAFYIMPQSTGVGGRMSRVLALD